MAHIFDHFANVDMISPSLLHHGIGLEEDLVYIFTGNPDQSYWRLLKLNKDYDKKYSPQVIYSNRRLNSIVDLRDARMHKRVIYARQGNTIKKYNYGLNYIGDVATDSSIASAPYIIKDDIIITYSSWKIVAIDVLAQQKIYEIQNVADFCLHPNNFLYTIEYTYDSSSTYRYTYYVRKRNFLTGELIATKQLGYHYGLFGSLAINPDSGEIWTGNASYPSYIFRRYDEDLNLIASWTKDNFYGPYMFRKDGMLIATSMLAQNYLYLVDTQNYSIVKSIMNFRAMLKKGFITYDSSLNTMQFYDRDMNLIYQQNNPFGQYNRWIYFIHPYNYIHYYPYKAI